jgi:DTW domain-containing protein YfiP
VREFCTRCRRPTSTCYCEALPAIPTKTRVVFLQHPRERKVAIGTARMAHLALPNSEFHQGVDFSEDARIQQLLADPTANLAVLFPSEGAQEPASFRDGPPLSLIVVDGTWTTAKKVLQRNPALLRLPRIGLKPSKPGNYRIRKEPEEHCLATIEAVVEVLGQLEGDPARFQPMISAFDRMVDTQIARTETRQGPPRRRRPRVRAKRPWTPLELAGDPGRLVLVYGEANAPSMNAPERFEPELVHLVALRPFTGERFEAVLAPRKPLADGTCRHVELSEEELRAGEDVPGMLERWRAFTRPDDVFAAWGGFTLDILRACGDAERGFLNLRLLAAKRLSARAGGIELAAERLAQGASLTVWAKGRAGRRLAAMEQVLRVLMAPAPSSRGTQEVAS